MEETEMEETDVEETDVAVIASDWGVGKGRGDKEPKHQFGRPWRRCKPRSLSCTAPWSIEGNPHLW
jgi:hypothetical protein